jgi:hypothetical protein
VDELELDDEDELDDELLDEVDDDEVDDVEEDEPGADEELGAGEASLVHPAMTSAIAAAPKRLNRIKPW